MAAPPGEPGIGLGQARQALDHGGRTPARFVSDDTVAARCAPHIEPSGILPRWPRREKRAAPAHAARAPMENQFLHVLVVVAAAGLTGRWSDWRLGRHGTGTISVPASMWTHRE